MQCADERYYHARTSCWAESIPFVSLKRNEGITHSRAYGNMLSETMSSYRQITFSQSCCGDQTAPSLNSKQVASLCNVTLKIVKCRVIQHEFISLCYVDELPMIVLYVMMENNIREIPLIWFHPSSMVLSVSHLIPPLLLATIWDPSQMPVAPSVASVTSDGEW